MELEGVVTHTQRQITNSDQNWSSNLSLFQTPNSSYRSGCDHLLPCYFVKVKLFVWFFGACRRNIIGAPWCEKPLEVQVTMMNGAWRICVMWNFFFVSYMNISPWGEMWRIMWNSEVWPLHRERQKAKNTLELGSFLLTSVHANLDNITKSKTGWWNVLPMQFMPLYMTIRTSHSLCDTCGCET